MIVIHHMEMPRKCLDCRFLRTIDGKCFCVAMMNRRGEHFEMNVDKAQGGRCNACPLMEIAPEKKRRRIFDFWIILIEKILPALAAICFVLMAAVLIKIIIA